MAQAEHSETTRRIIELRCLVGFLGEKSQFNWWPTSFYEATSIRFLEPVFSRTAPIAQYHGTVEAARRLHDEHLSVGSYHLFRLPEEVEQDLQDAMQAQLSDVFELSKIADQDTALSALSSTSTPRSESGSGPVMIGKIEDVRNFALLDNLTATYRSAFAANSQAFPYLVA